MTSAVTAFVTWRVSKNSSSVELAKVNAENERLSQKNQEDERRNRQSTYHQFIDAFSSVFQSLGTETPKDERYESCNNFNHLLSGVLIFGPPSVREGAYDLNEVYNKIWPALAKQESDNPEKPPLECWRDATAPLKDDFSLRGSELIPLMHADVTRGIVAEDLNI